VIIRGVGVVGHPEVIADLEIVPGERVKPAGFILHLPAVGQAVAVGIGVLRVGPGEVLIQVGKPVRIGILGGIVEQGVEAVYVFPSAISWQ
jgi:hypothetical protein